ncbi:MAG: hypothetical protein K2K39_02715 [Clostridia bacterium]|nr:hypothetical protein [Clostridia bacterium]
MKRFTVVLILILLSAVCAFPEAVYAAPETYARAAVRDAYFFTEKNTATSVFAVPYTYCVEVLRDDGEWLYVRYAADTGIYKALYGYCRKDDFTMESGTPSVTYLYKTVTLSYKVSGNGSSLPTLGEIAVEAAYYGTYYSGATVYSYVYCQGSFGYIEGANDDYALNVFEKVPPTEGGKESGENARKIAWSVGAVAIIVIGAILITVVLILFFVSKKPRVDS